MAQKELKWFYNSKRWKTARQLALDRDHYTCCYCGDRATEVHHVTELNTTNVHDPNISLNLNNLQSLCHECHRKITMQEHGMKGTDCDMDFYFDSDGNLQKIPPGWKNKTAPP